MWPSQLIGCHKEEGSECFSKNEIFCDETDELNKVSLWCWNYGLKVCWFAKFWTYDWTKHFERQNTKLPPPLKKDLALTSITSKSKCPCFLFILLRNIIKCKDQFFQLKIIDKMETVIFSPLTSCSYFELTGNVSVLPGYLIHIQINPTVVIYNALGFIFTASAN